MEAKGALKTTRVGHGKRPEEGAEKRASKTQGEW